MTDRYGNTVADYQAASRAAYERVRNRISE